MDRSGNLSESDAAASPSVPVSPVSDPGTASGRGMPSEEGLSADRPRRPGLVSVATSILLLVFSVIGAQSAVMALGDMSAAFQTAYDQYGLGEFTPFDGFNGIIEGGRIAQFVLWAVVAAVTILLLMRKRHAWYIPLIGGVLSMVLIVVAILQVMTTDPTLTDYLTNGIP
ncbi:hypothetical protein GCM10022198_17550 [Klugiella xanthotipulae]